MLERTGRSHADNATLEREFPLQEILLVMGRSLSFFGVKW
jgi:hypothetical protein